MELLQIQAVDGANIYSYRPIIRALVDLQEMTEKMSHTYGGFNRELLACLPGLEEHYCSRGKPGGFVERLWEGTLFGHIIEHVALELLTLSGQNIRYGKTEGIPGCPGVYEIVINYDSRAGAMEGLRQGFGLVDNLLKGLPVSREGAVTRIKQVIQAHEFGVSTRAIITACEQRGIPVVRLNEDSLLQLGYGCEQRRVQATMTDATGCIAVDIACDKGLTKGLLRAAGIPVPRGCVAVSVEEAVAELDHSGAPLVVKPYNGNQGKGVTLNLSDEAGIRSAFALAQAYDEKVLIEEFIEGRHYRLLVINNQLVAAAEKIPAYITGDGISSIRELVAKINEEPLRGDDHENVLTKIKIDSVVILTLAQKNLSLNTVPAKGEVVFLRDSANLSTGGVAHDVTGLIHPDNRDLAVYAAQVVGLDIAGVDLVIQDISRSFREANGHVIEVNAAPGIRMHQFPSEGEMREVGKYIVDQIVPAGNGRIPIVSVTGTNGKTTTTRLISKMLRDQGLAVGMAATGGIYVQGKLLVEGDTTGPESASIVLRHPDVQVAVLETARGGILRAGLGYDYADIAIVTNVSGDHLGQYGVETVEDVARVKSLVAEVVRPHSYVVLNADDVEVRQMARRTKGKVILFSMEQDNIFVRKHLGRGGVAVFVRRGTILLCQGEYSTRICSVKQIPLTWQGKAKHNTQNCLAAIASGWALGLSAEVMRSTLLRFAAEVQDNAGRLNRYEINGVTVVVDYGHNTASIREIIKTLRKVATGSLVGCITVPGDRTDATIREVARVAAKGFDRLIIREDEDLRGRKAGEIAELLFQEAVASGMPPEKIKVVLPELEAFQYGLDDCVPGETFVMFYEKLVPLENEIGLRQAQAKSCPEGGNAKTIAEIV